MVDVLVAGLIVWGVIAFSSLMSLTPDAALSQIVITSLVAIAGMIMMTFVFIGLSRGDRVLRWIFRPLLFAVPWAVFTHHALHNPVLVMAPLSLMVGQMLGLILWSRLRENQRQRFA